MADGANQTRKRKNTYGILASTMIMKVLCILIFIQLSFQSSFGMQTHCGLKVEVFNSKDFTGTAIFKGVDTEIWFTSMTHDDCTNDGSINITLTFV